MVIDTSAVIAIFLCAPEADRFEMAIVEANVGSGQEQFEIVR
jgi:uncharacterized protein with PIN domain